MTRTITLLAAPITVSLTMLLGWVILTSFGWKAYPHEMFAAGLVNAVGGMLAVIPLCLMLNRGAAWIVRTSMIGIGLRMGIILLGLVLASGKGWGLEKMPLIYWTLACYFPLLIAETATVAWLSHKSVK